MEGTRLPAKEEGGPPAADAAVAAGDEGGAGPGEGEGPSAPRGASEGASDDDAEDGRSEDGSEVDSRDKSEGGSDGEGGRPASPPREKEEGAALAAAVDARRREEEAAEAGADRAGIANGEPSETKTSKGSGGVSCGGGGKAGGTGAKVAKAVGASKSGGGSSERPRPRPPVPPKARSKPPSRPGLSHPDVRAIFASILGDAVVARGGAVSKRPPPFRVVVVPSAGDVGAGPGGSTAGGSKKVGGMRLSPPPREFEDGVYALLRPGSALVLSGLPPAVALDPLPERPWALSGPQYGGEATNRIQQRYCTPKGDDGPYRRSRKGSLWTLVDSNGEESFVCRVLHVYRSPKRMMNVANGSPGKRPADLPGSRGKKRAPKRKRPPSRPEARARPRAAAPDVPSSSPGPVALRPERRPSGSSSSCEGGGHPPGKPRKATCGWTSDEDARLLEVVDRAAGDVKRISWNLVARQVGGRNGKQCRERYTNHLTPDRKRGGWTEEEDAIVDRLQALYGNQWAKIAAALPGRADNDVKNRWHSRQRSMQRQAGRSGPDEDEDEDEDEIAGNRPKPSLPQDGADTGTPKVGQRVQARFNGNMMCNGTITRVFTPESSAHQARHHVMIHYDNGNSRESVLPNKEIHLIPMNNELTENEILLCHELLNLHDALQTTDGKSAVAAKNPVSEEGSHDSAQQLSKDGGNGSAQGRGDADVAQRSTHEEGVKPTQPPVRSGEVATAMFSQGPMANASHHAGSTHALHFQLAQNQLLEQQLIAAARLLTSVNPSLAVAAIASARQFNGLGIPPQSQAGGLFFPQQLQIVNNVPMHFSYPPPITNVMVPERFDTDRGGDPMATSGLNPNSTAPKADQPKSL